MQRYASKVAIADDEWRRREEEFQALEDSLELLCKGTVDTYRKMYAERGGEQFRPNPSHVKCEYP